MLQFSKVLASLCAGCLCTLTIHQIPALGNVLLPQTHAIPETSPIRPVDVMPLESLPTPAETAPAMSIPPTETQSPQTQTTAAVSTEVTVLTATATTTIPPETTAATESETTVAVTSTIPESDPFFQEHETWFKAYMDYRTITNTDSVQYAMEQNAWTDDRGLRRMADDYLVAMGTGWLESGCGERFAMRRFENRLCITLDGKPVFAEHTLVQPETRGYTGLGQWQGFTHQGVLYTYAPGKEDEILAFSRQKDGLPDGIVGASRAVQGVCVRALAMSGDTLFRFFERFEKLV